MTDRERFEAWINSIGADHDLYTVIEKEALWVSWQAALAQPVAVVGEKPQYEHAGGVADELVQVVEPAALHQPDEAQPDDPRELLCRFGKYIGEYWSNPDHAQYRQWPMEELVKEFLAAESEKDGRK